MSEIILPHGGYEKLLSYQKSEMIYDATASLEELLIDYKDYLRVNDYALWDKQDKQAAMFSRISVYVFAGAVACERGIGGQV